MNKHFVLQLCLCILVFSSFSKGEPCSQKIKINDEWTLKGSPLYCNQHGGPEVSPKDFLKSFDEKICNGQEETVAIQQTFSYKNIDFLVKGKCVDGNKHGNFTYYANNEIIFSSSFRSNEIVKTTCKVGQQLSHYKCFSYFVSVYPTLHDI